jgi:hypothetical protein
LAEYDQYCNLPDGSPWVPTSPGLAVEALPEAPAPEQGTEVPPNSTLISESFDPDNPDLCDIFNNIIPEPGDPGYEDYYENPNVIPPFIESIYINCAISLRTTHDFAKWPVSAKDEDLNTGFSIKTYLDGGGEVGGDNLITIPGIYSQSSLYPGAELADFESMSNGNTEESLKTVTNADFEAWIQIDFTYNTYIAQLLIGCDFNNSLPGGFGKWSADFVNIQYRLDGSSEWIQLPENAGEFAKPTKHVYIGQTCRYIRVLHYGRNLAITELMARSDRWVVPLTAGISNSTDLDSTTPINQLIASAISINTERESFTFTPDKLLYLMDFELLKSSGEPTGAYSRSWHSSLTRYWNSPTWPHSTISTSGPIFGSRSFTMPDGVGGYALRAEYYDYYYLGNDFWHIKFYCVPATLGTQDPNGNFYQYILDLAGILRIGIDDEQYYFAEIIDHDSASSQLVGGKFKDGNAGLLAANGQQTCVVFSCDNDELSLWINGQKEFSEPRVVSYPQRGLASYGGWDCFIGGRRSEGNDDPIGTAPFRLGKIDHIAIYKGVPYLGEADPFLSPTPVPPPRPAIPTFVAPLNILNSTYSQIAFANLTFQTGNSRTLNVPTHAEGDLLVAAIHFRKASHEIIPPIGWVLEKGDVGSELLEYSRDARIHIYSKVALEEEDPTYTWDSSGPPAINSGIIFTVRNGVITEIENKIAPVLTAEDIEGFDTYYTFDHRHLFLEAAFDELLVAGNCRTWTSGSPTQTTHVTKIWNWQEPARTQLGGGANTRPFGIELLAGPDTIKGNGAGGVNSMNMFGVKFKVGQPVPRYVIARFIKPEISISNIIEISKTTAWVPSDLNPSLEVWLDSAAENPYVIVSNELDIWKDQTIHKRDFRAQQLGYGGSVNGASYRPFLAPKDGWSGITPVQFAYPDTIGAQTPLNTWDFLATGPYHFMTVVQMGQLGAANQPACYLISTAHFDAYWNRDPFGPGYRFFVNIYGKDYRAGQLYQRVVAQVQNLAFPVQPMQKAVIEVYGNPASPLAEERIKVAVNGIEIALTRFGNYPAGILPDDSRRQLNIGRNGDNGGSTGIFHEWIVCSRELSAEDRQKALCYLAKKHKITEELDQGNACRENVSKAVSAFSTSEFLPFTTTPIVFTPAPVNNFVISESEPRNPTIKIGDTEPVFSESFAPGIGVLIKKPPLPATYSQSSVFNLNLPFAEPASQANMQNQVTDEILATATNGDGGWVMMDFGIPAVVDRVVVGTDLNETLQIGGSGWWGTWGPWYTEGAIIDYSSDGANWTTLIPDVSGFWNQQRSILEYAIAPNVLCRYLRIGYTFNAHWYFAVTEFYATGYLVLEDAALFGASESFCPPAIARVDGKLPAAYSQSSVYSYNGVQAATQEGMQNDVSEEPFQTGTDQNSGANWVMMDLGLIRDFSAVLVGCDFYNTLGAGDWGRWYTEYAEIQKSNDGIAWTTIADTGSFNAPTKQFDFAGESARYIRIAYTYAAWLSVTEFYAKP